MAVNGNWTIQASDGGMISFTSFISIDFLAQSTVASELIQPNSFTSYNKTQSSAEANVVLALTADKQDVANVIDTLNRWVADPITVTIITPEHVLQKYTLEGFSYSRSVEDGVGVLFVELRTREVREIGDTGLAGGGFRISQVSSPNSASTVQRGITGVQNISSRVSLLSDFGF